MSTRVNKKEVFKYLVMPQLTSRFKDLFTTGFQYIPFFIALVYQCVRILPANHPYVSAENIGQFGVRHVIAEAANNIQMNKQNIDQILVFGMIMLGLGIFAMQIFMMVFGIAIQPALAQAQALTGMTGLFTQADPSQDLAYMFLDMVFGLPQDVFGSCVSTSEYCFPQKWGRILQQTGGFNSTKLYQQNIQTAPKHYSFQHRTFPKLEPYYNSCIQRAPVTKHIRRATQGFTVESMIEPN